jgi:hypothetical protein
MSILSQDPFEGVSLLFLVRYFAVSDYNSCLVYFLDPDRFCGGDNEFPCFDWEEQDP